MSTGSAQPKYTNVPIRVAKQPVGRPNPGSGARLIPVGRGSTLRPTAAFQPAAAAAAAAAVLHPTAMVSQEDGKAETETDDAMSFAASPSPPPPPPPPPQPSLFRSSPTSSPVRSPPLLLPDTTSAAAGGGPGGDWTGEELAWMQSAEMNVLMPDIELCNPGSPPVRAVGVVIASYNFLQHHILRRFEWVIRRDRSEYNEAGRTFWSERAPAADRYLDDPVRQLEPVDAAQQIRDFFDRCWATVPRLSLLIDDINTDCTMLNRLLTEHRHLPLNYDASGGFRRTIYVSRDLMRGKFSMIDPDFINPQESNLYLEIHRFWLQLVALQPHLPTPPGWAPLWTSVAEKDPYNGPFARKAKQPPLPSVPSSARCLVTTPEIKHLPVWDAMQTLLVFFRMEDITRWHHTQLAKLMNERPKALLLPKAEIRPYSTKPIH